MSEYILIHNPRCSKSRETLGILEANNIEPEILLYLEKKMDKNFLENLFKALSKNPKDCLRTKEEDYKSLDINWDDDSQAIDAIIKYPKILERPILLKGDKAVIGRPPELVKELISK